MNEIPLILKEALGRIYCHEVAAFAMVTGFIAFGVCLLDLIAYLLFHRRSLLGLGYGGWRTAQALLFWPVGAALAAYVGGLVKLFSMDGATSCVVVGITWPTILPRLIAMADKPSEPEQEETEEKEEN